MGGSAQSLLYSLFSCKLEEAGILGLPVGVELFRSGRKKLRQKTVNNRSSQGPDVHLSTVVEEAQPAFPDLCSDFDCAGFDPAKTDLETEGTYTQLGLAEETNFSTIKDHANVARTVVLKRGSDVKFALIRVLGIFL